jgi:myo-inositol-1(or 4)-monophosphatase
MPNPKSKISAPNLTHARKEAVAASRAVGILLRRNLHLAKSAHEVTKHDIKLDLDVRSQKLIETRLHRAFPQVALLGEEGVAGDSDAPWRWVVDPIDGTVNFAHGIPHACISIALQGPAAIRRKADYEDGFDTFVGVVYDPFCDELWTAIRGQSARLNGRPIRVSRRHAPGEAIVSIGFSKTSESLEATLPAFNKLIRRVRKVRLMGAAALALTYVASGRFDAYLERGIRLWDIAAGGLILECAGGEFLHESVDTDHTYRMKASNALVGKHFPMPD